MDNNSIILQGTDICLKQIQYTEFGLKQSKNTPYLVTAINIVNHVINNIYVEEKSINRQHLLLLLSSINIKI